MKPHRTQGTEFLLLQAATDLLAIFCGLFLAYWLRFHGGIIPPSGAWSLELYLRLLPWSVGIWLLSLHWTGCYQNHPRVITFNRARRLLKGSALAVALIVARNYFWREEDVARLLYPMAFLTVTASLVIGRGALQGVIQRYFVGRSLPRARVLIIGIGPTGIRLAARIRLRPEYAYELAGFVSAAPSTRKSVGRVPILGCVGKLGDLIREHHIQEVFVAQSELPHGDFLSLFLEAEAGGARVSVVPTLSDMMRSEIFYDEIAGVPMYVLQGTPLHGWNLIVKRGTDMTLSFLGILCFLPMLPFVYAAVKFSSPGPFFYKQKRLGLDGRKFNIYKFRTMPVDAEKDGPGWGDQDDPRATRFGRFLRRWNLDEVPQLWNVFRGDMSLVGPRPERPHYVKQFRQAFPRYMARHKVRTGMTGWAQVHGLRGDTSISQRLRYDLYYIENWSLWLDFKILIMTVFRMRPRAHRHHKTDPAALLTQPTESSSSCPQPASSTPPSPVSNPSTAKSPGSPAPGEALAEPSRSR
ncbi:MAG: undecaprenyl-phosphate glucose phosphotransferase [Sumerlaeia bacterium]